MQEVFRKLKFKETGVVVNAPAAIENALILLGFATVLSNSVKSRNTLIFISSHDDLLKFLNNSLINIERDSVLWLAYPKGTSKIKTDINRDSIRVTCEEFGITTVTAISIDETWTALRFRPIEKVGK